jgi:DNA-binding winged helix-turn-helix (wHTH) protein
MIKNIVEAKYPINFRENESEELGQHLRNNHSVEIYGMKRVGIGNFLNFFIHHPKINKTYVQQSKIRLFIPIDLNDLIEREIFPFWRLTFKRIVDIVEHLEVDEEVKDEINDLFTKNIQIGDHFLTLDAIRKSLVLLTSAGFNPAIFFLRFDRLKNAVNEQFFNNLQSLNSATHNKLSFIFTSDRTLSEIAPDVFSKTELNAFTHKMCIKPANNKDMNIVLDSLAKQYDFTPTKQIRDQIINLSSGHIQYLRLCMIIINELNNKNKSKDDTKDIIMTDERIQLQSEEIIKQLSDNELNILEKIFKDKSISKSDKDKNIYLWETGIISQEKIFSPFLKKYLKNYFSKKSSKKDDVHLTKKEHLLYTLLLENKDEITSREIIEKRVWPEYSNYGVSDWSIDRLISRLRKKIKILYPDVKIKTIRTRGFMLIDKK